MAPRTENRRARTPEFHTARSHKATDATLDHRRRHNGEMKPKASQTACPKTSGATQSLRDRGTSIAKRPPLRTVRAGFPHTAPPRVFDAEAVRRPRMEDLGGGRHSRLGLRLRRAGSARWKDWVDHLRLLARQTVEEGGDFIDLVVGQLNAELARTHNPHRLS